MASFSPRKSRRAKRKMRFKTLGWSGKRAWGRTVQTAPGANRSHFPLRHTGLCAMVV